jgi:hypothetical protein
MKAEEAEVFVFPASFAQQRLWFLDQLFPGNFSYNVSAALRLTGSLNLPALELYIPPLSVFQKLVFSPFYTDAKALHYRSLPVNKEATDTFLIGEGFVRYHFIVF